MRGIVASAAALLGATGVAIATFIIAGWTGLGVWPLAALAMLGFAGAGTMLLRVAARRTGRPERGTWWWLAGGCVAYAIAAQLFVGTPPRHALPGPEPMRGTQYWNLGHGARLAYRKQSAALGVPHRAEPVIFLHDGPGIPALPAFHTQGAWPVDFVAADGYDVYYYDQRGAGFSSRLELRTQAPYSVAGHVNDLEAIRRQLGARTMILVGHGWGATLAINYLLAHPSSVSRMVLESPGPLWYPEWSDLIEPSARARMTDVQASALAVLQRPSLRLVLGRMMADFSRRSAHTLVADWEADQWWTRLRAQELALGQPRATCLTEQLPDAAPPAGLGFFANSYTLADALRLPDPRPALKEMNVPVLVLRGLCDYTSWRVSYEYLDVLPGARYVAVPAAGHQIWLEKSEMRTTVIAPFLRGEVVPLAFYTGKR